MRRFLAVSALVATTACSDAECTEGSTQLSLKRRTGEFGLPGDKLRFTVETNLGPLTGECVMVAAGDASCTNPSLAVKVADTGGRVQSLTISLSTLPSTVRVTIARVSDGQIVGGPVDLALSSGGGGPCPRTQMTGAAI